MDTKIKQVEVLPLVKYYMEELELARLFDKYVPNSNGADIDPAQVLCLMVTVIPRNFNEVKGFLERVREGKEIEWQHDLEVPDSRKKGNSLTYRIHEGERMRRRLPDSVGPQ